MLVIILNQTKIENTYSNKDKVYYGNVSFIYFVKLSNSQSWICKSPGKYTGDDDGDDAN